MTFKICFQKVVTFFHYCCLILSEFGPEADSVGEDMPSGDPDGSFNTERLDCQNSADNLRQSMQRYLASKHEHLKKASEQLVFNRPSEFRQTLGLPPYQGPPRPTAEDPEKKSLATSQEEMKEKREQVQVNFHPSKSPQKQPPSSQGKEGSYTYLYHDHSRAPFSQMQLCS